MCDQNQLPGSMDAKQATSNTQQTNRAGTSTPPLIQQSFSAPQPQHSTCTLTVTQPSAVFDQTVTTSALGTPAQSSPTKGMFGTSTNTNGAPVQHGAAPQCTGLTAPASQPGIFGLSTTVQTVAPALRVGISLFGKITSNEPASTNSGDLSGNTGATTFGKPVVGDITDISQSSATSTPLKFSAISASQPQQCSSFDMSGNGRTPIQTQSSSRPLNQFSIGTFQPTQPFGTSTFGVGNVRSIFNNTHKPEFGTYLADSTVRNNFVFGKPSTSGTISCGNRELRQTLSDVAQLLHKLVPLLDGLSFDEPRAGDGVSGYQFKPPFSQPQVFDVNVFGVRFQPAVVGSTIRFNSPFGTDTKMTTITTRHQCLTAMEAYKQKSLEEIRLEDYMANRKGSYGSGFVAPFGKGKG